MNSTYVNYRHLEPIPGWLVVVVPAMAILFGAIFLACLWRLWRGRWPQFSLRAAFTATTASAAIAGLAAYLFRDTFWMIVWQ